MDDDTKQITRPKLTAYQRIARAAKRGAGVRLSADEVFGLARDTPIRHRAEMDDEEQEGE